MLITKYVDLKVCGKTLKHYREKGYVVQNNEVIPVKVSDLTTGSHAKIIYQCDICGKRGEKAWKDYLKSRFKHDLDTCSTCKSHKAEKTNLERYGEKYHMLTSEGQKKIKSSIMEKYGVENVFASEEIKNTIRETNLKKYGTTSYTKTDKYHEKTKETNLKKYGTEYAMQNDEVKMKVKKTNIRKYGVENVMFLSENVQKIKRTNLERYGVDCTLLLPEIIEKSKATCIDRYGVDSYSKTDEYKEKVKKTCLEKYGYESALSSPKIREKINNTLKKNGDVNTSSQQISIYRTILEKYANAKINYVFSKSILDVALFIDNFKIDIEYDGWYWHKDTKEYDRRRDEFLKSRGWKILRIRGGHSLPSKEELFLKIDELVKSNKNFSEIILKDWRCNVDEFSYDSTNKK